MSRKSANLSAYPSKSRLSCRAVRFDPVTYREPVPTVRTGTRTRRRSLGYADGRADRSKRSRTHTDATMSRKSANLSRSRLAVRFEPVRLCRADARLIAA
jgi:hypothetical protein